MSALSSATSTFGRSSRFAGADAKGSSQRRASATNPSATSPPAAPSPSATPFNGTPAKVRLALDWTPNTDHTGFFVAKHEGWYRDAGIDLQVLPYDDDTFDVVTGFTSFFFADDMVGALREAGRVARPGAPVVIQAFGRPEKCALEAVKLAVA